MAKAVLVTTDFSPISERAIPHALRWARHLNTEVHLLYVVDRYQHVNLGEIEDHEGWLRSVAQLFEKKLAARAAELAADGVPVLARVITGHTEDAIIKYARENACLLVCASHGMSGLRRFLLGSIAARLAQAAPVPTLVVPPEAVDRPVDRLLVTTDLGGATRDALDTILEFAKAFNAHIDLFHADVDSTLLTMIRGETLASPPGPWELREKLAVERLDELAKRVLAAGLTCGAHHHRAPRAADAIVERAILRDEPCIVMTSHGRGGLARAWMGSVTDEVLRRTTRPVLVLRSS